MSFRLGQGGQPRKAARFSLENLKEIPRESFGLIQVEGLPRKAARTSDPLKNLSVRLKMLPRKAAFFIYACLHYGLQTK